MIILHMLAMSLCQHQDIALECVQLDKQFTKSRSLPGVVEKYIVPDLKRLQQVLWQKGAKVSAYSTRGGVQGLHLDLNVYQSEMWRHLPGIKTKDAYMKSPFSIEYKVNPKIVGKPWRALDDRTPFLIAIAKGSLCLAAINRYGKPLSDKLLKGIAVK